MACFDTVIFKCPRCGGRCEEQTKAGVRAMFRYPEEAVPPEIANEMIGTQITCYSCNSNWRIAGPRTKDVQLHLESPCYDPDDNE